MLYVQVTRVERDVRSLCTQNDSNIIQHASKMHNSSTSSSPVNQDPHTSRDIETKMIAIIGRKGVADGTSPFHLIRASEVQLNGLEILALN
jgi:formate-dependent nitrite reductase cytochrome c552 subunit